MFDDAPEVILPAGRIDILAEHRAKREVAIVANPSCLAQALGPSRPSDPRPPAPPPSSRSRYPSGAPAWRGGRIGLRHRLEHPMQGVALPAR